MTHDYRPDYDTLELDERADWARARATYRRQVNRWHPDRFTDRPREREHAQQRFINLTRAFDNLRAFHRENARLPFEPIRYGTSAAAAERAGPEDDAPPLRPGSVATGASQFERPSDEAVLDAGILGLREARPGSAPRGLGWLRWAVPLCALVVLTLGVFVVLDRNARQAAMAEGREVLRRTAPSEFMQSGGEMGKQSARRAVIEGQGSGKIGEPLMRDLFR